MRSRNTNQRIEFLKDLIRRKSTGSPGVLAVKLSVSESTVYRYIRELRKNGGQIKYDRRRQTYLDEGGRATS